MAALCANGGAGGSTAPVKPGIADGGYTMAPTASAPGTNRGGAGGAAVSPAGVGATSATNSSLGAGGGGVGRIRINGAYVPSAAVISPQPTTNP